MRQRPASTVPGIAWPAIVSKRAAHHLALMVQLESSQWWTAEALRQQQFRQLTQLLRHAFATTDFYRQRLGNLGFTPQTVVTPDFFQTIPLLQREEIQNHLASLTSRSVPEDHGETGVIRSSGSTGRPLKINTTSVCHHFWQAFGLRDHLWHQRDFSRKHAALRIGAKGKSVPYWSSDVKAIFSSGPNLLLDLRKDVDAQIDWMRQNDPAYLLTYPSVLREMARRCQERQIKFPGLQELRTFGETLPPEIRAICRQAWGVGIKDMYSSMEIGYMALQCPEHDHYHVMSEGVLIEILDEEGRPCPPGRIGRVVVTDLHNFATPLIRYEILDYAEAGATCSCGRGLPVLKRIMGRQRNMMTMPDGSRRWPSFGMRQWPCALKIMQIQIIQKEIDRLLIRLVVKEPLEAAEEAAIAGIVQKRAAYPLQIDFEYPDAIDKPANLKFEMFFSEV